MTDNPSSTTAREPYKLTLKRGFLALILMYVFQTLVGIAFSYGFKFFKGPDDGQIDIQIIGMLSVLLGGSIVLIWIWTNIRQFGPSFLPQIGIRPSAIKLRQGLMLVFLLLGTTHFLAWIYRSVFLPQIGHGGIVGGGSQMFAHIQESGSGLAMAAFLLLALVIGPVMEEFVFRGFLQSALTRHLPGWAAIIITSILFTAGHSPMILWPMYFLYSVTWGWVFMYTKSLKLAILFHILSNLFYAIIAIMGWDILA